MSLEPATIYGWGLFTESDYLSLSGDLRIKRNYLVDSALQTTHKLHPLAAASLAKLERGVLFHAWLLYMLDEQLSRNEIYQLINFINNLAGFQVQRGRQSKARLAIKNLSHLLIGLGNFHIYRRARPTMFNLGLKTAKATVAISILFAGLCILCSGANAIGLNDIWYLLIFFSGGMWLSAFIHEFSHLYFVKRASSQAVIISGGLRLGVLYPALPPRQEMLSAISGPATGALLCFIWSLAWITFYPNSLIWFIGVSLICFHLISWWPGFSDGREIFKRQKLAK